MSWFVKTEKFLRPYPEMAPHILAHISWIKNLRAAGVIVTSGYLTDEDGIPGGGGLLLLQAPNYSEAKAIIKQDPMLLSGGVTWDLQQLIFAVGGLTLQ